MGETTIGLLHPGEMGAAVGQCLAGAGHRVLWAPEGRSAATSARAAAAGLIASGLAEIIRRADLIMSVCPPHAALDIARQVAGFGGIYLDANAISPATAREVAGIVDGRRGQLRGRRDHRDSPGDAGIHPALPIRSASRGGTRSIRRQSGRRESGRP